MLRNIVPLAVISLLNALIGVYVFRKQRVALANRAFAFFAFSVASWTLAIAVTHHISGPSTFFTRVTFAVAAVMVFSLFVLLRTFPHQSSLDASWGLALLVVAGALATTLSFTPHIVSSAELTAQGLMVTYGNLHPLYALYVYTCFGTSVLLLLRKYWTSVGLARLQFHYLFLGLLVPALGVSVTNLLIPLWFGTARAGQYGPYFALVFLAFTAHALIHYRLMDIRLVLRRGVTFLLALAASILVLFGLLLVAWVLVPFEVQVTHLLLLIAATAAISVLLPIVKLRFARLLDRYVYRDEIDYRSALHDASRALVGILDLDELLTYTLRTTIRAVRAERAALYLLENDSYQLTVEQPGGSLVPGRSPLALSTTGPIVRFLSTSGESLVAEEIPKRFPDEDGQNLLQELRTHRWGLVVPIQSERLVGIIAVEPKLSGDPFFPEELQFVAILVNQLGIALTNAQLYKQVILANEYIENILRTIDSGVIAVDSAGKVTMCNSTAERLTGIGHVELASRTTAQLPDPLATQLRATLSDGLPLPQVETILHAPDESTTTPIVCSSSALTDSHGSILGAVVVFSDLSRIKALENEKRRAERLAALGALASGIAHEIKNPLVAIRTFAELLPDRFAETDFREDFSKVAIAEIDRIDGLVSRLRGIAAPPAQPADGPVDMREPVTDTLALLRAQLEQAKISVRRILDDDTPLVSIESDQLKQLLLNLIMNAVEAMEGGGELTVRVGRKADNIGPLVVTTISDTGRGIPESLRAHIFEPFFTTKARGSGLGLAICRSIIDANRGTIRIEPNKPRPGTTIVVEFPAAEEHLLVPQKALQES
jgi:signal transduction histidine kinase